MPNEIDIAGLRELERKATPGPWQTRFLYRSSRAVRDNAAALGLMLGPDRDWADAELTAEVRNALPALLDELERLQERVKELELSLSRLKTDYSTERKYAEGAEAERDALKAKLERAHKCTANIVWALDQSNEYALDEARRGVPRLLSILNEKAGEADEADRGEKEPCKNPFCEYGCPSCDGVGVIERRVAYSEKVDDPCEDCNGTGKSPALALALEKPEEPFTVGELESIESWLYGLTSDVNDADEQQELLDLTAKLRAYIERSQNNPLR